MDPWSRRLAILSILALAFAPMGCGDDDNGGGGGGGGNGGGGGGLTGPVDVPESWWGLWEETSTSTDCSVTPPVTEAPETYEVQFCPESTELVEDLGGLQDELDEICDLTFTASQIRLVCNGTIQPEPTFLPSCQLTVDIDATATIISETSYSYTTNFSLIPNGGCSVGGEGIEDVCETSTGTATRISTDLSACDGDGLTREADGLAAIQNTIRARLHRAVASGR